MTVAPLCKAVIRWVTPDPSGMKNFAFEENKCQQGKDSEYYPILVIVLLLRASRVALVVKNLPANAGDIRDSGLIPGGGNSNPLQYSCLENPMDRGAWWATLHRAAKSQTWLKWLSTYACIFLELLLRMLGMWRRVPGIHCIAWFPDDVYVHSSQCLGDFMEIDLETQI